MDERHSDWQQALCEHDNIFIRLEQHRNVWLSSPPVSAYRAFCPLISVDGTTVMDCITNHYTPWYETGVSCSGRTATIRVWVHYKWASWGLTSKDPSGAVIGYQWQSKMLNVLELFLINKWTSNPSVSCSKHKLRCGITTCQLTPHQGKQTDKGNKYSSDTDSLISIKAPERCLFCYQPNESIHPLFAG